MGALSETYVDPSIAGNSGTGTIGDPYGDLQYALDTMTRDATNGDRINIKAGTDEILAATLSLATYGTPAVSAPLLLQGYTTAAGDGGIGGIDANNNAELLAATSFIGFKDLHLHNTSGEIIDLNAGSFAENCEINDAGSGINVRANSGGLFNCYIHDLGSNGITNSSHIFNCVIEPNDAARTATRAILGNLNSQTINCIIIVDSTTDGITLNQDYGKIINCSIYSNGGTGDGIGEVGVGRDGWAVLNNIIEGFSGAGGNGVSFTSHWNLYGFNNFYNNTTNESLGDITVNLGSNTALGSSPFTNPGTGDFTVSSDLEGDGYPASFKGISTDQSLEPGAAQIACAGGAAGGAQVIGGFVIR